MSQKYEPKLVSTVTQAFNTFDQNNTGQIQILEIGNVIRSLGVYVTDAEIRQYVQQMQEQNPTMTISKQVFVDYMCALISKNEEKIQGPTLQQLMQAFEVVDVSGTGFFDESMMETLRMQLTTLGDKMTSEEVDTFFGFAKGSDTKMDWKAYVKTTMEILWKQQ